MKPVILSHHQSRREILAESAMGAVFAVPFVLVLLWLFQFQAPALWIGILLLVFILLILGHTSWSVWKQRHGFWCVLWSDRIACRCPDETMGSTFELQLDQILEIRAEEFGDSLKHVLVTADGQEYWLTTNFGNPAPAFVLEIQERCPKVRLVDRRK